MEVKYVIILLTAVFLAAFIIGYLLGIVHRKKLDGGSIIFEPGEEGPKCTIKFDCDEKALMQKLYVVLKVVHKIDS